MTLVVPAVFAQEPEPEAPLVAFFAKIATVIPVSVLIAVATSVLGYLRSTPPEQFELDKVIATIIISLIMGVLTEGLGWAYSAAEQWLANGAITLYIYWMAKIIAMRVGWIKLPNAVAKT